MTKQEIEQIVSKLKAYVDEQFAGYGQEEKECVSFEREYMRRLADDMPVRQGLFRLFLRNLNSMLQNTAVKVDASPNAIPALVDGRFADSGLTVDENGRVLYDGVWVNFIQYLNATQYTEFDNIDKQGIYFYNLRDENNVHQSGFLFVMRSSDLENDTKQIRIEVSGIKERTAERYTTGHTRLIWSDWKELGTQGGSGVGKPGSGESSEVFNDMENNQAAGDCAHAEGSWTVANNEAEHAEGAYNKSNTGGSDSGKTLHSVGIGTADNSRKNAHEIMRNGDHYVYGIGGYDGTNPGTAKTLQEVVNEGGSPDAVLKNASNQVGDTFSLTSENQKGNITVKAGVQGNATLEGGVVKVKGNASATLSAGSGITVKSNGNTKVEGYTIGILATLSSVNVQASDSVNVSTTDGDINLNPGGQGKAKVNGKEVATKDATVAFAGLYNEEEIDACDIPGNYGCNIQGGYSLFGTDFAIIVLSSGDDSTYRIQIGIKNDLSVIAARYGQAGSWGEWTEIGGGSSVEVVQTTGQSTTSLMSQKGVTNTIGNLSSDVNRDEGLYEDVDTLGETVSRTSTNGEQVSYINHRIEEYAVGTDASDIFTYDDQVHTLKLAQFTVHPQEGDLSFIADNNRGVLLDPTWSYVNFICSNEPRYFSARIGGGKCVLVDTNGDTSGDHYIQLFAEAAYSASTGNIEVSIFAEYKLSGGGAENNPLYINGNLPGYLRIWIV